MENVYKYFSSELLDIVFQKDGYAGLKCSFPKDYNDPYELFLSIGMDVAPDLLAFYDEVVQKIPQLPTTCFSRSPVITPMWAHYAGNQTGFVLEFDVDGLSALHKLNRIRRMKYRKKPKKELGELLAHAAGTKKFRHSYFLTRATFNAAYFTKFKQWSYEKEVRLIAHPELIHTVSGLQILYAPNDIVKSIIIGANFPRAMKSKSQKLAKELGINWYELTIGKCSGVPYFRGQSDDTSIFTNGSISLSLNQCDECQEPINDDTSYCSWCSISEYQEEAATSNPFRILNALDMLDEYFKEANKVGKPK